MKKNIYSILYFWLICALVFLGCDKKDNEPFIYDVTFTALDVDPATLGYQGGQITFTMNATWAETTATALNASFQVQRNNSNFCRAYDWSDRITKGVNYIKNLNTSNFYTGCNQNGSDYTIVVYISQSPPGSVTFHWSEGISNNVAIVNKAREMKQGNPRFFEPPCVYNNYNLSIINISGSVGWTWSFALPTVSTYRSRLTNALTSNPSDWFGYDCSGSNQNNGFPYPNPSVTTSQIYNHYGNPFNCNAGFPCFAFVYEAARQAGYTLPYAPQNAGHFMRDYGTVPLSNRQVGDLVLYNIDRSNNINQTYLDFSDHAAIITEVNSSNLRQDRVISCFGYDEFFKFGIYECYLWDFHSNINPHPTGTRGIFRPDTQQGGYWDTNPETGWDNWVEANIRIVRIY